MIAIIDYKAGNLTSVERAIKHLGFSCKITSDPEFIIKADRVIFPGVGAAGSAMESLNELNIYDAIVNFFKQGKPLLGICLGTQIIMDYSQENNDTKCVGLIKGRTTAFSKDMKEDGLPLKIPHMGWNNIKIVNKHPILSDLKPENEFYFVHSYHPDPEDKANIIAFTEYGIDFASVLGFDNLVATQFHPEKSGRPGLTILKNFCEWKV